MAAWQAGVALLALFIRSMQYAHGSGAACQAKAGIALRAGMAQAQLIYALRAGMAFGHRHGFTGFCAAMCPITAFGRSFSEFIRPLLIMLMLG